MKQAWFIGECMIELRPSGARQLAQSFAGDVYNTAVYFRRLTDKLQSCFVSAVGDDNLSRALTAEVAGQNIDTTQIATIPDQLPGLYWIETTPTGERSFLYWRQNSAARAMLDAAHAAQLSDQVEHCQLLYFSGITLAILDDARRRRLLDLARRVRAQGGWVVFDSNYRPRLWESQDSALTWTRLALEHASHALVTVDDEVALHGDVDSGACCARILACGVNEVVVKLGAEGCLAQSAGMASAVATPARKVQAVDTTAAGDSFNAAYLAARLAGAEISAATAAGCRLAARVVSFPGAIISPDAMPDESDLD